LSLAQRLAEVDSKIDAKLAALGRKDPVVRIVVTKNHPVALALALYELGVRDFGENRDQEAGPKAALLAQDGAHNDANWHFVGQLQSNKAKRVVQYATTIHSVDRASLLDALIAATAAHEAEIQVFLQVNLTDDPNRGGVNPDQLLAMASQVASAPGLQLLGVMAVGGLEVDPRVEFERVAALSQELQLEHPSASKISAGMSGDYEIALEYGATHLRIGTAITGNRNY
jgi:pyridoxal phosphate enzyme (YggS family)